MVKSLKATNLTTFWSRDTESGRAWRYVFGIFVFQRIALTLAGLLAAIFALNLPVKDDNGVLTILSHVISAPHITLLPPAVDAPTSGWQYFLTSPWQRWDSEEYLAIAYGGYSVHPALINFPPLYPLLVGILGRVLLNHFLLAALVVSNLCYIGGLYFFYRLTAHHFDEKAAGYACIALAFFPTAHFFLMPYTESLFLLLTLAAFYALAKNRWWLGCFLAGLAAVTRLQGIVILLPIFWLYWQQFLQNKQKNEDDNSSRRLNTKILALFLVPLWLALFELYAHFSTDSSNEVSGLAHYWGITITWPGDTLVSAVWNIVQPPNFYAPLYNAWGLFLLIMISLTMWKGRKILPVSYQLYAWASILIYLTRKGDIITTVSLERYLLLIFPAFMYVGLQLSRKKIFYRRRLLIFSISFLLQFSLAFGYALWFWTG